MFQYHCLNPIAGVGLANFNENYQQSESLEGADAVLVRSAAMHGMELPKSLLAVARAGAGVNNIPLADCAEQGIVVFNTPGANANGVKELVLAGMLLASRDIAGGIEWVKSDKEDGDIAKTAEKQKKKFAGCEISGKKLGIIGLGAIGQLVANAATHLGIFIALAPKAPNIAEATAITIFRILFKTAFFMLITLCFNNKWTAQPQLSILHLPKWILIEASVTTGISSVTIIGTFISISSSSTRPLFKLHTLPQCTRGSQCRRTCIFRSKHEVQGCYLIRIHILLFIHPLAPCPRDHRKCPQTIQTNRTAIQQLHPHHRHQVPDYVVYITRRCRALLSYHLSQLL